MKKIFSLLLVVAMLFSLSVSATANYTHEGEKNFVDVNGGDWYFDAVEYVKEHDLIDSKVVEAFSPNTDITRGEIIKALYRMEGRPETVVEKFDDVFANSECENAVNWAINNGIANGVSEKKFAPEEGLTREQMATFIYRYMKYKGFDVSEGINADIKKYADYSEISDFAVDAIKYVVKADIIIGISEDKFAPKRSLSRAQAATILVRIEKLLDDKNVNEDKISTINKQKIDKLLEDEFTKNDIPGMSVAITDGKKIVYERGFGVTDRENPYISSTEYTMYRMASVTKLATSMMILSLVEDGVLDLDTPIKKYIPWLTLSRPEAVEQMTLRHLLSHTSGLPKGDHIEGSRDENSLEEDLKQLLPTYEIETLPKEEVYKYSNVGPALAAQVAISVTGKSFSNLVKEYVFEPLGMNYTTFDLHKAVTYPFSIPHIEVEDKGIYHYIRMNTMFRASDGMFSNTIDLSKFARCLMNGGKADNGNQVLGEEYVDLMFAPKVKASTKAGHYYGTGGFLLEYKDRFLYGHDGTLYPGNTSLFFDKESGYGVIILINTMSGLNISLQKDIFDILTE